jgi:putative membrane protein
VGLLSIAPTVRIIGWGRRARAEAGFAVPEGEVAWVRRWLAGQFALFAVIPVAAAMMARGW